MDLLRNISENLHYFIKTNFPDGFVLIFQILSKFILLLAVVYVIDFVLKNAANILLKLFYKKYKKAFLEAILQSRVHYSFAHFVPIAMSDFFIEQIFWRHPKSFFILDMVFTTLGIVVSVMLVDRFLKSIEKYYIITNNRYKVTAFRAIYETLKIVAYFVVGIIVVSRISGITLAGILGYLGAITAVLLLVFRDTILGFVTGVHVSTSKNLKVGDWIGIKKYDIEGTVQEINLLTTKIQNFDKTVSTIPTYDLLSTEIRNHQVMYEGSSRRIKRSIYFNIKSFSFVDDDFYNRLKDINLISEYLETKYNEIKKLKSDLPNNQRVINGQQLTNIGIFRIYTLNYLKRNPNISQNDTLLVRQLEITPQGMPLEIYCFTTKADLEDYEQVQADIFDHILTAAKEFDLEVMQVMK
ncbi:MAG: mechanosensitive ion channel [Cloacibacterium sp.]|nr:mechanosensitive ion channel [Cloacibacterium sp.]